MLRGCAPDEDDATLTLYLQYSVSFGCDDDSFRRFRGLAYEGGRSSHSL